MGGCLPTLVQLPILFALYAAFAGPPFTDKTIDVKVNVVPSSSAQSFAKEEATGATSIYVSKDGVPAKVVIFPGNSTIAAGTDLNFGVRAVEGKLPADFSAKWKIVLPKNHEVKEALPVPGSPAQSSSSNEKSDESPVAEKNEIKQSEEAYIDSNGHAVFTDPGEYHIQGVIPGIAKGEPFAFVSGLGKVATGVALLKPANFDIVFLIIMFGISMYLSQKLTVPAPKPSEGQELDEQQIIQQQTMKTMPIVTTAMFFFFPIPAGVYLYLVVSNIIQTFQTWLITKMPEPDFNNDVEASVLVVSDSRDNGEGDEITKPTKNITNNVKTERRNGTGNGASRSQAKKKSKRKK